ncbi:MAG: hypothetical protein QOK38_2319 [Acidobacteriaceae bacterium]|jgi:hypothetical protein|nr:hypothetical protein [Acidobacteriaceae bacterium]
MRCSFAKLRWGILGLSAAIVLPIAGSMAGSQTTDTGQMQQPPTIPAPPFGTPPFGETPNPNDPLEHRRLEKMEKARNVDRQKQLERDTDKLLALAKELKEEVGKSNADTLSVDVVKKAAEIEKLAKSVKDRMRG